MLIRSTPYTTLSEAEAARPGKGSERIQTQNGSLFHLCIKHTLRVQLTLDNVVAKGEEALNISQRSPAEEEQASHRNADRKEGP